jgi:hypothetical protein
MKRAPDWLACQIIGIADFICRSPGDLHGLRELADEFHDAALRIEAEIAKREIVSHSPDDEGMFG